MKKIVVLLIVSVFILSTSLIYAETKTATNIDQPNASPTDTPKDRASRGMNNLLYGPTEVADNLAQTNTKGTAMNDCNQRTRTGFERGIARFFTGVWQLATFWYADQGCATSTGAKKPNTK